MTTKPSNELLEATKKYSKHEINSKAILERVIESSPEVKNYLLEKHLIEEVPN